ncbi:hypothetical protein GCM10010156_63200 [Planobispora rosea]|uniref:SRPBCC family protein n=1 Tax=Planobispora rosea TaxID=35762 RepID=A0A8J3WF19_PLARO|nr:SRPBCC family protein [Planobispora rosea]GGS96364.1 hypothetical protein GCM10010156_63200 [Planobispora rosea]GIH87619.1 hypothetical protein Pro02_60270 [Planobispora rosea]
MSAPSASASIEISAPPETVYDLVADLTDMSAWNTECERVRWVGPVREPRPGARFRGINRNGWRRWSTICTITAADPGRTFAYHVRAGGVFDVAIWRFDITETESGCRVEQRTWDRRGLFMRVVGDLATGVADRASHNAVNMRRTLESLKAVAERP